MENLGIVLDDNKINSNSKEGLISKEKSKIKLAVIPINEEYVVANEVSDVLENMKSYEN